MRPTQRLLALAGLIAIVGSVVGGLYAAGLIGNQGGGDGIENARLLDPPRGTAQPEEVGVEVGQLAPDFEISDFQGGRHKLSDFRGRPVELNFWATWCVPCLAELPEIQQLHDRHGDGLAVIELNRRENVDTAKSFFQSLPRLNGGAGVSFTVNGLDPDGTVYDAFVKLLPPPLPVSIFINANGVITHIFNGQLHLPQMEQAVAEANASTSAA